MISLPQWSNYFLLNKILTVLATNVGLHVKCLLPGIVPMTDFIKIYSVVLKSLDIDLQL